MKKRNLVTAMILVTLLLLCREDERKYRCSKRGERRNLQHLSYFGSGYRQ